MGALSVFGLLLLAIGASVARAQPAETPGHVLSQPVAPPSPVSPAAVPAWRSAPRGAGRLRAKDIGLVINTADPYSVAVGEYYIGQRGLEPQQVLRLELPSHAVLTRAEFNVLEEAIARHFGPATQALALAWAAPSAVACNSITGALALGFDEALCQNSCTPSRPSPYANTASARPFADFGLRPSMLLAARSVDQARALIDRGVAADHALLLLGRPPAQALFVETTDAARNVRSMLYPPEASTRRPAVTARRLQDAAMSAQRSVVLVQAGIARVRWLGDIGWLPGGLGDHLTSFGGALGGKHDHTTVLDWIESYWKSVRWPQQSLFVGEPLAAPFAPR